MKCKLLLFCLLASCGSQEREVWTSVAMDGRPRSGFEIVTQDGRVVAGFDGCNRWAVSAQKDMIDIEQEECASDPLRAAYWALVRDGGAKPVRQERQLLLRRSGHQGVFIPKQ